MSEMEEWKSVAERDLWIPIPDARGRGRHRKIQPGQTFKVSSEDRMTYQYDPRMSDKADCYKNGSLQPVKLVEDAADFAEISTSENHRSDSELLELVKGQAKTVEGRIEEIDNPNTLARLLRLMEEADTAGSKVNVVQARYDELTTYVSDALEDGLEKDRKIS